MRAIAGLAMTLCCAVTTLAESQEGGSKVDADRSAIQAAYTAWAAAADAKDMSIWATYLAPDALFLPPNHAALRGEEAIREFYARSFADPLFSITCQEEQIEIAPSGDFAWSAGTCESSFTGSDGAPSSSATKWVKVWKKTPDGAWKCAVNSWSSVGGDGR